METLPSLFAVTQALGALIGALFAVWGELAYVRAAQDDRIDRAERLHLDALARGLKFGMTLLLLSSFGLIVVAYLRHETVQPALTASYWVAIVLSLLVIGATWSLSRGKIRFALGSATVFSAWWFLVYLMLGRLPELSFGAAVALYVVATVVLYLLLRYVRLLLVPTPPRRVL